MAGIWPGWLADAARETGHAVIEVAGWPTRGHRGFRVIEGLVAHHTGTPQTAAGDYPSLRVVRDGRAGLAGPLCNYGLGRNGTIYVVAAGVAHHAGASRHAGFVDLNDEFLGVEAEHAGGTLPWPDAQLDAYIKLSAAVLRFIRRDSSRYVSHRDAATPPGRKPDPKHLTDAWMRAQIEPHLRPAPRPAASPSPAAPASGATALPALRPGQRSDAVRKLQQFMTTTFATYNAYTPTGFYGEATEAGIREFQRRVGLEADGIVGFDTNRKLWSYGYRG